ncbi:MAG: calcium/sodium antiporter [Bacilli bacterium]|nr:calcium/sodium antiporter [Bacilli bacterium]
MFSLIFTALLIGLGIGLSFITSSHIALIIVMFLIGLGLIIKGGDLFVDAASDIAEKSGVPKFIIGATIVSVATTLPEMVASITGTVDGALGLAVGNAIGSVTANTGMIMAISIMFMPAIIKRKEYAFKSILLMLVTASLLFVLFNGSLNIWESIIVILFFASFIWENIASAKLAQTEVDNIEQKEEEKIEEENNEKKNKLKFDKALILNLLSFVVGAAGIFFGAKYLVSSGTSIATTLGVSEDVIGLTLVAIGTSLPELVTTITAIIKKQSALSVGNIIGANIIDMSLILPICAFVSPGGELILDSMQTVYLDLPVSLGIMMVLLIPMLIRKKFSRLQGIIALLIYIAYLVVIVGGFITF